MEYTKQIQWEKYDENNSVAIIQERTILRDNNTEEFFYQAPIGDIFKMTPEEVEQLAKLELSAKNEKEVENVIEYQNVLVRDFGNIKGRISEKTDIGISLISSRDDKEKMFIPWTSIILITDKIK